MSEIFSHMSNGPVQLEKYDGISATKSDIVPTFDPEGSDMKIINFLRILYGVISKLIKNKMFNRHKLQ